MINYHVKKSKRTRFTYRFLGFVVILVCTSQVVMFIMGYGQNHKLGTIFAFALLLYGIYLFINSFRPGAYDMDYQFREEDFTVHTRYGDKVYQYSDITNLSHIIPENELLYSLIHISIGKTNYILPFSLKKDLASQLYSFLGKKTGLGDDSIISDAEERDNENDKTDGNEDKSQE